MGEVYRARDTRLGREVALKILPEALAQDPDRLARFEREAHVLASLNHPNIAHIHGVEDVGAGVLGALSGTVLVLELVEGPTLAEMIAGPLPLSTTLSIARQIAEALEAAHAQGIVHRDLKPANVKVRADGTVKVLDFGLAKALTPTPVESVSTAIAESPTLTSPSVTQRGVILGTPAYMAPEQARGKVVDRRADIWAFGCVVYEMLTGSRPFDGEDVSEVLARIIDREPDWGRLPPNVPPVFAAFLRQCLQKNPRQRVHDIADVRLALDGVFEVPAPAAPGRSARWPPAARFAAIGLALLAMAATTVAWYGRSTPPASPGMRLEVDLGSDVTLGATAGAPFQISPDGERVILLANGRLLMRRINQTITTPVPGTESATGFVFSPDGRAVAFAAGGKLKRVTLDDGALATICELSAWRGGSWGEDGTIVFAQGALGALLRVPAAGGTPMPLTTLAPGELTHRWPAILPGGRGVLFTRHTLPTMFDAARIEYVSLSDGSRKTVLENATFGRLLTGPRGAAYLLYLHEGTVYAAPFALGEVRVLGDAVPVAEGVASNNLGAAQFDVSRTGMLVYRSQIPRRLDWLAPSGATTRLLDQSGDYVAPSLSPDGRRIAFGSHGELWVRDLDRGTEARLARGVAGNLSWVPPDGQFMVFGDGTGVSWIRTDGSTDPQPLLPREADVRRFPSDVSADGRRLAFQSLRSGEAGWDLWTASLTVEGAALRALQPEPFLVTKFDERGLVFSGDGRLAAYSSNEDGPPEQVFVRPVPQDGRKVRVSTSGGMFPRFARRRPLLFFLDPRDIVMRASYAMTASGLTAVPTPWARQPLDVNAYVNPFTMDAEASRLAALVPDPASRVRADRYLTFWIGAFDEIRRQDPARR